LNLTYEVRESLSKHCTLYDKPGAHPLADGTQAPIEGQIANLADRVAYDCHDLEDALGAEMVDEAALAEVELWRAAIGPVRKMYPDLALAAVRRPILDALESMMMDDIVRESRRRIAAAKVQTVDDVRACPPLVALPPEMESKVVQLERFLQERVYRHRRLIRMDGKARRFIEELFKSYVGQPRMLPPRFHDRILEQGLHRVICDYIAGMTDRFCQHEYKRLFEPFEQV
jgi:dGTPase